MKTIIATDKAPAAIGPYTQAVRAGEYLFISGQIALTPDGKLVDGDIAAQSSQALDNLAAVVREAGLSLRDVVQCRVYLADMNDFGAFNEVYSRYFDAEPPARACVAVAGLPKNVAVEIEAIAYCGGKCAVSLSEKFDVR